MPAKGSLILNLFELLPDVKAVSAPLGP